MSTFTLCLVCVEKLAHSENSKTSRSTAVFRLLISLLSYFPSRAKAQNPSNRDLRDAPPPPSRTRSAAAECLPLTPRRGSGVGVPWDDVLIESTLSRQSCAHLVPPPFSHPLSCLPLLLLCSPVLSSCSSPRASYSFWSDHSKQFFFFPGTLLLSVWRSSFRSQHGPQQQHLQIPPPGAPRPHGGLCTHR